MRLHRLVVCGFGPFRDEQVVDFEALSATGLFLLCGDTGAGKSSVLDAVAYALYGRVAGSPASATRIRSDHADPDLPTRVELELTLRGRRLRISRAPEWQRRKIRGTGTTRQPTKVLLERFEGGTWACVSTRVDEVGDELGQLLGMNHQQFCQVVLLPQGDFAQFLRADAEARKRLLERLFGTERFSAVESWLVERRRERHQELTSVDRDIGATIARLAEVTGDPAEPPAADDPAVVSTWAERQVATIDAALAAASGSLATARAARAEADQRLDDERDLAQRQGRLIALRRRAAALAVAAPRNDIARIELAAAHRVTGLTGLLDAVTTASGKSAAERGEASVLMGDASRRMVGTAASAVINDLGRQTPTARTATALEHAERDLRAEIIRLESLLVDEERLVEVSAELEAAKVETADLRADAASHEAWLSMEPARTHELRERLDALARAVSEEPAQRSEHEALRNSIDAAVTRERLAAELADAAGRRRDAIDAAQRARQAWQDLRERRLAAMAGELAAALIDGEPCPVCGGLDHPAPAERAAEAVADAAREDAALVAFELAEQTREAAAEHHDAISVALQGATSVAGAASPAVLTERRDALAARLEAAAADRTALDASNRELAELRQEAEVRRLALTSTTDAHGRAAQRTNALVESTAGLRRALGSACGEDPSVAARIARLGAAVDALVKARDAVQRVVAAAIDLATTIRGAEQAALDAGFADLDVAADARRDEAAMTALAAEILAHDEESVLCSSGLGDPGLVGTQVEPTADPAGAEQVVAAAAAAAERASAEVGRLDASAVAAARLAAQLALQLSARTPLRAAYATVDGLSRLAEGTNTENRLRMRLSYFVLSARLEQVAAAASERLLRMTDGRFSLVHTDDRAAGNQRSGLGLAVCDSWYGTTRDPAALSGGESFMASLALALGLADVVVAEAGGAFMDTLFVDEGFGSLDEATLDAVLDVLDGLREGGRAVGLVSHVGELRQRVPSQLTVRRGRSGSTLTLSA